MDTHSRSLAKAISWRITGSIDTMILSFLITGSMKFAAAIGLTEVVTKSVLYYLHERAWLKIPFGRDVPAKAGPTKTGKADFMCTEAYQPETGA
jgi:uncharacterized membrane protein